MAFPVWLRIFLIVLTLVSFLPQFRRLILRRGDSTGISPYYVLLNLVVATEQVAISFFFLVNGAATGSDVFVQKPPDAGDWVNFVQFALVWSLWLVVFVLVLYHSRNRVVAAIYISYFALLILPLIIDSLGSYPEDEPPQFRRWYSALWMGVHSLYLTPIVTLLAVASFWAQLRVPAPWSALSVTGLAWQTVVFALLTISWLVGGRLRFGFDLRDAPDFESFLRGLNSWYQLVGFVAIDHAVFTVGQALLLWLVIRQRRNESAAEREPLLSG